MNNQEIRSLIQIDLRTGTPAYMQIIQQVQGLILRQELCAGDQLPTVRQLAAQLSINFNTVARAYRLLDRAGFITTQRGRGTYLLDSTGSQNKLRAEMLSELTASFVSETRRLGYPVHEVLQAVRRQILEQETNHSQNKMDG